MTVFIIDITIITIYCVHHVWCDCSLVARREYPKGRRLVWPDQLRYGDRIRHQMVYVPNNYAYEKTPIKRILLYNGINPEWEVPRLDRGEFIGCPVRQCTLTIDRSVGSEVDALLFRHTYTRPSFKRPPNQVEETSLVVIIITYIIIMAMHA